MSSLPAVYGAATLLVNATVWIFGGYSTQPTNGLYALDVSKSWPTSSPSFTDFSSSGKSSKFLFPRYFSTMALDEDQTQVWIGGGNSNVANLTSQDHFAVFDTQSKAWSDPQLTEPPLNGVVTPAIYAQSAVSDSKGMVYYYGGLTNTDSPAPQLNASGPAMLSLETRTSSIALVSETSPIQGTLAWHTATLVNDTLMYVIGGLMNPSGGGSSANIRSTVYNTATSQWSNLTSNSTAYPSQRYGHSAVLSADKSQIIVFGGMTGNNVTLNDVWTLDVTSNQWKKRTTSGTAPSGIAYHNAVIVKNQMIVMFGQARAASNSIYVLDTATWTWLTYFGSNPPPTAATSVASASSTPSDNSTSSPTPDSIISPIPISAGGIAGITVAAVIVFGVAILSVTHRTNNRIKPHV